MIGLQSVWLRNMWAPYSCVVLTNVLFRRLSSLLTELLLESCLCYIILHQLIKELKLESFSVINIFWHLSLLLKSITDDPFSTNSPPAPHLHSHFRPLPSLIWLNCLIHFSHINEKLLGCFIILMTHSILSVYFYIYSFCYHCLKITV